jgi:hypothetical protein
MFYNYIFLDPRKPGKYLYENFSLLYEPFYVGKGKKDRYKTHLRKIRQFQKDSNKEKQKTILDIWSSNLEVLIILLNFTDNEKLAYKNESNIIKDIGSLYNGGPLTNLVVSYPFNASPELRKTYGRSGNKHHLYNKGHSEEAKKKISDNHADFSGSKNGRAKKWKLTSPNKIEHIICGELIEFCRDNKLSIYKLKKNIGNIVTQQISSRRVKVKPIEPTTGWKLDRI